VKIAIVAPSPVPFTIGGLEGLATGLGYSINKYSEHQCELIKLPSRELTFWDLIDSYHHFYNLDLSHFELVISLKYPAWMVRHNNHICYMAHKLRGLYDTYAGNTNVDHDVDDNTVKEILYIVNESEYSDDNLIKLFSLLDDLRTVDERKIKDLLIFPGPFIRKIVHFMDNVALSRNKINKFFSISDTVKNRLDYFPVNANVETIYVPPSLRKFQCDDYDYLFTISRLDSPKRIDLLIDSMKYVPASIKLKIAGTGPQEKHLEKLAEDDSRIEFLGFVNDAELIGLYANALAVLYTPYQEDLGLITIEAMMSKKPVITTTDSGGPLEFVKDFETGFVTVTKPQSIAEKINYLVDNVNAARQMGEKGYEIVKNITWKNTVNRLLDTEIEIVKDKNSLAPFHDKKKILVLATYCIFPPRGGGQHRLYNLYKNLAKQFDITVLSLVEFGKTHTENYLENGLRTICIPQNEKHARLQWDIEKKLGLGLFDVLSIENAVYSTKYVKKVNEFAQSSDVIVCSHPYLFNTVKKENERQILVYEAHNVEYNLKKQYITNTKQGDKLRDLVWDIEKRACVDSDIIFSTSEEEKTTLSKLYEVSSDKIVVVPNGVDTSKVSFFTNEDKQKQKHLLDLSNYTTVLFVGSWHPPNLEALKFIVNKLAPKRKDCIFLIVGSINNYYKSQSLKKYPNNVLAFGVVSELEKMEIYKAADVAINPMISGSGTNLKMLDYMASGISIISTPIGARGLEIEDSVIICELEDFNEALNGIISGKTNTNNMRKNAKQIVDMFYDWGKISKYVGKIINECVKLK
jgi:glycosyltransferase involved in cell wall biosynthesis